MILIGLTGSIGMGKSTVAQMFRDAGVPVFDADACVRALQGPGGAALPAIETLFPGTTDASGVDRQRLGAAVFGKPHLLARLEAVMHPLVGEAQRHFLRRHARHRLAVLDVPLLFEAGGWRKVDVIVVVSAPARVQRARVLARAGMTPAKFGAIMAAQMRDADKRRRADVVIATARGKRHTQAAVRSLVTCLRTRGVRYCRTCAKSSSIRKRRGLIRRTGTGWSR